MELDDRRKLLSEEMLLKLKHVASSRGVPGYSKHKNAKDLVEHLIRDANWQLVNEEFVPSTPTVLSRATQFLGGVGPLSVAIALAALAIGVAIYLSGQTDRGVTETGGEVKQHVDGSFAEHRKWLEDRANSEVSPSDFDFFSSTAESNNREFGRVLDYPSGRPAVNKYAETVVKELSSRVTEMPRRLQVQYLLEAALLFDRGGQQMAARDILERLSDEFEAELKEDDHLAFRFSLQSARVYDELRQPKAALRHYIISCEIRPDFAWPHFHAGTVAQHAGEFEVAIHQFRKVISILEDRNRVERRDHWIHGIASARTNAAQMLFVVGKIDEAKAEASTAVQEYAPLLSRMQYLAPQLGNAKKVLADTYQARGDLRQADKLLDEAIALVKKHDKPEHGVEDCRYAEAMYHAQRGFWREKEGKDDAAIEAYDRAVAAFVRFAQRDDNRFMLDNFPAEILENRFHLHMKLGTVADEVSKLNKEIRGLAESTFGSCVANAVLLSFRGRSHCFLNDSKASDDDFIASKKLLERAETILQGESDPVLRQTIIQTELQWLRCLALANRHDRMIPVSGSLLNQIASSNADRAEMYRWYALHFRSVAHMGLGNVPAGISDLDQAVSLSMSGDVFDAIPEKEFLVDMAINYCHVRILAGVPESCVPLLDFIIAKLSQEFDPRGKFLVYTTRADVAQLLSDDKSALEHSLNALAVMDATVENAFQWNSLITTSSLLSTSKADIRNGKRALALAKQAEVVFGKPSAAGHTVTASAHADLGDFEQAIESQKKANALLNDELKIDGTYRLKSYQQGIPWREPLVRGVFALPR